MKRSEILDRLGYRVSESSKIRVIVDTDAKNEADDQYAIMHHLLSPSFDVCGIVAAHFEEKNGYSGTSMEESYNEISLILSLAEIDDVPAFRGEAFPISKNGITGESEGVDFIIREARRDDTRELYIAVQGAATNVAAAILKAPDIADRLTVIWNGGGPYPVGRPEFNVTQDPEAVRVLLESKANIWQVPQDVYATFEVSLAELAQKVRPCGKIGEYLFSELEEDNIKEFNPYFLLRTGENWTLGDNTTVQVLLENRFRGNWYERKAPRLSESLLYEDNPDGKTIRVYSSLDVRMALEDFFSKMRLVYMEN